MKVIFLVVTSKSHNHGDNLNIDRVDLTRKLDAINTWVDDVIYSGNDVIFFDGGNQYQWFDNNTKTLHLTEDDSYEVNGTLSRLFPKVKTALKWVLENRDFDVVYLGDDDIFINLPEFLKFEMTHDYMGSGSFGGGGFYFNKKSIQSVLNYNNETFSNCDQAIYSAILDDANITKSFGNDKNSIFYFPGELYHTVHYTSGKRSYFLHNIFKHYQETGVTNRKILLGAPLLSEHTNNLVTYESTINRKTKRWYDFTIDPNNWEYHGGYLRSYVFFNSLKNFWPYAKKATKFFVINYNVILHDYVGTEFLKPNLDFLIEKCKESLIDENNLLLCSENVENIEGWVIDNTVKETLKLNFEILNNLNYYKRI